MADARRRGRATPLGQRLLGDFYFNGEDGSPDRAIAEEWYARAAASRAMPDAQDMLSWMLADGDHRKPDYARRATGR